MAKKGNSTAVAEPEPPAENHNLTADQQAALFLKHHLPAYRESLRLKDKAAADFRNVCKVIKAEGGSITDIKTAIKLSGEEGEKAVKKEIEDTIRVARWLGHSVGYQMEMFEDRRPGVDRAYDEGKVAGMGGNIKKPPYSDPSLPQYKRWMEGWDDGQAVLTMKLKAPEPPPQTVKAPKPQADAAA
jgi:ribosome modulation factor